jgi:hypothetical protein
VGNGLLLARRRFLTAMLALTPVWPFLARDAAAQTQPSVEKTEYKGWKNNLVLRNGTAEVIVTLDVGPRIISYRMGKGKNVFKEYPQELGKTGEPEWKIRGGHRLWTAPEDTTRTYAPDNGPVNSKDEGFGRIRFTAAGEAAYGVQKELVVQLAPQGTQVTVVHVLKNTGAKPTTLAPWALSVMAPGGTAVIPLPEKRPHPGPPQNARSSRDYAPNQTLVLWPFFDFKDPRWRFGTKYITVKQDGRRGPTKIGLAHSMGWVAYWNDGTLFVKRFEYDENKPYPDNGCNFETFTNEDMLEIESLGPVMTLAPGESVEWTETWELANGVSTFQGEAGIDLNVLPRIKRK